MGNFIFSQPTVVVKKDLLGTAFFVTYRWFCLYFVLRRSNSICEWNLEESTTKLCRMNKSYSLRFPISNTPLFALRCCRVQ